MWHFVSKYFGNLALIHIYEKSRAITEMTEKQPPVNAIIAIEIINEDKNSRTAFQVLHVFLENWKRWREKRWRKKDEVDLADNPRRFSHWGESEDLVTELFTIILCNRYKDSLATTIFASMVKAAPSIVVRYIVELITRIKRHRREMTL